MSLCGEFLAPIERGRTVIGQELVREVMPDRLGEAPRVAEIGLRGFPPHQVGIFGEGDAARDGVVLAGIGLDAEEAFRRALAGEELAVARIDIGGEQLRRIRVGARQQHGRHALDIGCQPRGVERADELAASAPAPCRRDGRISFPRPIDPRNARRPPPPRSSPSSARRRSTGRRSRPRHRRRWARRNRCRPSLPSAGSDRRAGRRG